jgi:hypothetical protein
MQVYHLSSSCLLKKVLLLGVWMQQYNVELQILYAVPVPKDLRIILLCVIVSRRSRITVTRASHFALEHYQHIYQYAVELFVFTVTVSYSIEHQWRLKRHPDLIVEYKQNV